VNVQATVEVTAHSRDVLEFNLRRPWLLAAVKAQSHPEKDERERNSPDCQNAAPATGGGRTSTPLTRSVWLVQAGFIFAGAKASKLKQFLSAGMKACSTPCPGEAALLWVFANCLSVMMGRRKIGF